MMLGKTWKCPEENRGPRGCGSGMGFKFVCGCGGFKGGKRKIGVVLW